MIYTHESSAQEDQFDEKKWRPKLSWHYPFKNSGSGDLFFSYWTEFSSVSHPSRKTACVFKNPENAGMVGRLSFQPPWNV